MICSIGAVNATDLDDNSAVEVSSDVDDSISVDEVPITDDVNKVRMWLVQMLLLGMS
nr:hypothetical protein [Methanobrevibacter smithii]